MALTKEERAQRAKERREENDKLKHRYPYARLHDQKDEDSWVQVMLHGGEKDYLTIRTMGKCFDPDESLRSDFLGKVRTATIRLDGNLFALAGLIRGLTLRYNALIQELNAEVENTPALELAKTSTAHDGSGAAT